jgi:hypothetical protein
MQRLLLSVCALLVVSFLPLSAVVVTIGTGTSTNSAYTYPAPYGNWYTMARHQILVRASEIIAPEAQQGALPVLRSTLRQRTIHRRSRTSPLSLSRQRDLAFEHFDNTGWTTVTRELLHRYHRLEHAYLRHPVCMGWQLESAH